MGDETNPSTVVLIHGAWHDSSTWDEVVRELAGHGRASLAVELPAEDPAFGATEYAGVVIQAITDASAERVLLVGHSMAGLVAPVVAEELGPGRVTALILVAPLIPTPGGAHRDAVRADPEIYRRGTGQVRVAPGVTAWNSPESEAVLYRGVAEELTVSMGDAAARARVTEAVARLRPQAWTVDKEVTPLKSWPEVPTTVVICERDEVLSPERMRARTAAIPGVKVVELPGGHFPMLTRPARLAELIVRADAIA